MISLIFVDKGLIQRLKSAVQGVFIGSKVTKSTRTLGNVLSHELRRLISMR